ncbi:AMP-binding protein [Nocardioides convexus]|uniref:AMP-binding protein n=1 Tax=Nocardioides convexus TaxID=2712224 RepID=UPI0024184DB3|nr:AMP-binding protein [Nocardioides convexus]
MHGHGGALLEQAKVAAYHFDLGPGERLLWYTTPSWMMWNFVVGGLLTGASVVAYDGSPAQPGTDGLWALAAEHGVSVLGMSPGYVAACQKAGVGPQGHDLSRLRRVGISGSTFPATSHEALQDALGPEVQICSISGGTDVVSAFVGPAPHVPVWPGESVAALPRGRSRRLRPGGPAGARGGRRARRHPADALDAAVLLGRRGRQSLPRRLLRHLPRRVAPRRLDHADRPRLGRDPRPLRRHPEPQRHPDGQRRHLRAGRGAAGGPRGAGDRAGGGRGRLLDAAVRRARGRGGDSTRGWTRGSGTPSGRTPRRATCRTS